MDIEKTYRSLLALDSEEAAACAYYQQTHRMLEFWQARLVRAANQGGGPPYDFSCLSGAHAEAVRARLERRKDEARFGAMGYVQLQEAQFMADGSNVELNNAQRYITMVPHTHDFFELECTLLGKCIHTVENQEMEMKAGDIVIVPPLICHNMQALPDGITINIKVRKSTFEETFMNVLRHDSVLTTYFSQVLYHTNYRNSLTIHCGGDPFVKEILLYMYAQQMEAKPYADQVIENMLATFFTYLIQNYENEIEFSAGDSGSNERINEIEAYLRQNFRTASLRETAAHFYLSQPYLSAYIKQHAGCSFSKMLRDIRMQNACWLLRDEKIRVDAVCELVGYKDPAQFIKTFRSYFGITPKQYQKKQKSTG